MWITLTAMDVVSHAYITLIKIGMPRYVTLMGVWEGAEHTDNKSDVGIWNNLLYEYAGEKA